MSSNHCEPWSRQCLKGFKIYQIILWIEQLGYFKFLKWLISYFLNPSNRFLNIEIEFDLYCPSCPKCNLVWYIYLASYLDIKNIRDFSILKLQLHYILRFIFTSEALLLLLRKHRPGFDHQRGGNHRNTNTIWKY